MRSIQSVRILSCLAVFCLSVPAVSHGTPASAAQTETLDNGAVTATFEDGALVRLRNTASNRVLELSGDSATLTVNGEQFAAPGRKLIATERLAGRHRVQVRGRRQTVPDRLRTEARLAVSSASKSA